MENLLCSCMRGTRPPSGWHAHASLGPRAKEEAALGGQSEGTHCVVRVVVRDVHTRAPTVFLRVAGRRAIRAALARGQPPVLVRFEPDLRYKGCKRGQYVVAEEVRDGHLRRLLALEPALGVGRVGLKEMCAQCSSFVAAKTACSLRHDCLRKGAGRHV